ncbi:MAG: hypothetical protein H3C69_06660, partial [Candidatus Promineofilum sp.]|nr:hypothetical protein [Promineifilum sp.]
ATLVGIAADSSSPICPSGSPLSCSLPLVWRAEAETTTSYRVFVHLVDEAGNLLAQSDAIPANWTRPTTGWLPDEYVTDTHSIAMPEESLAGPLSLRIGLYDPDSGARLTTGDGDFATVPFANTP